MLKMIFNRKIASLFLLMFGVLMLAACSDETKTITLGEGDWDSNQFHDQIVKFILENGYDYEVNVIVADTALMVTSLRAGDLDASVEVWSDNIPEYDDYIADGDFEEVSMNFADNEQGLYIPRYLADEYPDLVTVQDLLNPDIVDPTLFFNQDNEELGLIYGGPEGWSATNFLKDKMEAYGLDEKYQFKPIDSNATLSATLVSAYDNEEPWLGYNWEPTWIMGLYDMVLLEDSEYSPEDFAQGIGSFPSVDVTVAVRTGFAEDYPEAYDFFSNYATSTQITNEGLAYMQENEVEADEAAIHFLKTNEELWSDWVTEDALTKIKEALDAA